MTDIATSASQLRAAGEHIVGPVAFGQETSRVIVGATRADLPDTTDVLASLRLEVLDGEVWSELGRITFPGGVIHGPRGSVVAESSYAIETNTPYAADVQVRGVLDVLDQSITTALRIAI